MSLNKGSKTSIGCNVGKEVRWANEGKKGEVIFKITADMVINFLPDRTKIFWVR